MTEEYAVMKQVGEGMPEEYSAGFINFDAAENEKYKAENRLYDMRENGIKVKTASDAERALAELKEAQETRFYVAVRTVTEWQETT